MEFIDRSDELSRLDDLLDRPEGSLAVLWGRRRVGKTRLLLEWARRHEGLYTVADQSAAPLQREYLARAIAAKFRGFDTVTYRDWPSLFTRLAQEAARTGWRGPFILDEMPYLAAADPALPSVLQNWIDHTAGAARLVVGLAGSSQRMMQGAVLGADAPLYGRATELLHLRPFSVGYLADAFGPLPARRTVEIFALWGGIPRYWELAAPLGSRLEACVDRLVLDPRGPLHEEVDRLLLEETPSATALRPLLDLVGAGVHRLSEMAGRLSQPATSLSRPLKRLVELGLIHREQPFGDTPREGKRSLYRIADPFVRLWFAVVAPNRSMLADSPTAVRTSVWRARRDALEAQVWEELCRACVPRLHTAPTAIGGLGPWRAAQRYWRGQEPEYDVVALSVDGTRALVGESKWTSSPANDRTLASLAAELRAKGGASLPIPAGVSVVYALFVPELAPGTRPPEGIQVVDAAAVVASQRTS